MKECLRCKQLFPKNNFHENKHTSLYTGEITTYLSSYCNECNKIICKQRRHTLKGLISDMYNGQVRSSKTRKMPLPNYSKNEFEKWLLEQPNLYNLVKIWINSGFDRWLKPSCDRIDNNSPYTFTNIQLVTTKENFDNYKKEIITGVANKNLKAVNQFTKEGVFIASYHSIHEACRNTSCSPGNIQRCCTGEYKSSKGFIWKYAHDS